jgi:hypothetical protein
MQSCLVDISHAIMTSISCGARTSLTGNLRLLVIGLEQDMKTLTEHVTHTEAGRSHVMLSYEWGCQPSVLLIKSELEKAGEVSIRFLLWTRRVGGMNLLHTSPDIYLSQDLKVTQLCY